MPKRGEYKTPKSRPELHSALAVLHHQTSMDVQATPRGLGRPHAQLAALFSCSSSGSVCLRGRVKPGVCLQLAKPPTTSFADSLRCFGKDMWPFLQKREDSEIEAALL